MADYLEATLREGLATLGMSLDDAQVEALLAYLDLLQRWNKVYNLTAVRQPTDMVVKHLLDSLAVLPHIPSGALLDVGTGAGLPGIPLAIARPEQSFTLLDSNVKKTRFVNQVVLQLGLTNVTVIHGRCEEYQPDTGFAAIISRAFAEISKMVEVTQHLLADGGQFLAMKGVYPAQELEQLGAGLSLVESIPLQVPELGAERHLLIFRQQ